MPKPAIMPNGCAITICVGCEELKRCSGPVRDDGSEVLHEFNFMRTCDGCDRRLCLLCMPEQSTRCTRCVEIDAQQGAAA